MIKENKISDDETITQKNNLSDNQQINKDVSSVNLQFLNNNKKNNNKN